MNEREENREATVKLVAGIVAHLRGWKAVLPPQPEDEWTRDWVDLVRADGATIRVKVGGFRLAGRVSFYGIFPNYRDGSGYTPDREERVLITCSATRDPAAIAKDVQRRVLPKYLKAFKRALAYVRETDRRSDEGDGIAHRIADIFGGEVEGSASAHHRPIHIRNAPGAVCRLSVQPSYSYRPDGEEHPASVSFEVHHLDPERAARVLAIIAEADAPKSEAVRVVYEDEGSVFVRIDSGYSDRTDAAAPAVALVKRVGEDRK